MNRNTASQPAGSHIAYSGERYHLGSFIAGPRWDRLVSLDLAKSLQAQALTATGDVLRALEREQLRDVFPAWARLKSIMGITIPESLSAARHAPRPLQTVYERLRVVLIVALSHAEASDATVCWLQCEAAFRAAAIDKVLALSNELKAHEALTDEDIFEDGPDDCARITAERAYFAGFAYPDGGAK